MTVDPMLAGLSQLPGAQFSHQTSQLNSSIAMQVEPLKNQIQKHDQALTDLQSAAASQHNQIYALQTATGQFGFPDGLGIGQSQFCVPGKSC
eukprot:112696-Pyramimonas_sp.AAC.1